MDRLCQLSPLVGAQVGLLDLDICGPSIPRMCGVEHEAVASANKEKGWCVLQARVGMLAASTLRSMCELRLNWPLAGRCPTGIRSLYFQISA